MRKETLLVIIAGAVVGLFGVILVAVKGNPPNMGFCIACFERDIAGAIGLHRAGVVQYIRPEILGIVLGALIASLAFREFRPEGGSAPVQRFLLGMFVMFGALVFLGCPLRMVLRLAGGDLNAVLAVLGFVAGIYAGVLFLKAGFNFGRAEKQRAVNALIFPAVMVILLVLLLAAPVFNPNAAPITEGGRPNSPIFFSVKGPGAMAAPIALALAAGLIVGFISQRGRLCLMGGTRDMMLIGSSHLLKGFIAIFVVALVGNIIVTYASSDLDLWNVGFLGQPVAHNWHVWNFLGMSLVGLGSVLLGGCPLRQLVLAGRGNSDSAISVAGMIVGAGVAHNFMTAASPKGVGTWGIVAVFVGLAACVVIGFMNLEK
jgi:YedE family putative selenium metabolism protein